MALDLALLALLAAVTAPPALGLTPNPDRGSPQAPTANLGRACLRQPLAPSPLASYLKIAPFAAHDSRFRAREIAGMPLRAKLVVLLACDAVQMTAADEGSLEGDFDLAKAFLAAGARSVLAPQWKVPFGPHTELFLENFYREYSKAGHKRADVALAEAQRLAVRDGIFPAVWAAWMLLGDRN